MQERTVRILLAAVVVLSGLPAYAEDAAPAAQTQASSQSAAPSPVLLDKLVGLRLIDKSGKLAQPAALRPGLVIDGPQLLNDPEIERQLGTFIGKPFSQDTMNAITNMVAQWYRKHHRPFVDVAFPEQDISGGVVQAIVTEFRLGHLRTRGNRWFSDQQLLSAIELKPGDIIDTTVLDDDLAWLNQNTYRQVKIVAEKSEIEGATDLVLETADRFPWRFYAGFDTEGPRVIGRSRWSAGFDWGNAFWAGQDLSYQFTSSDDFWLRPGYVGVGPGSATFQDHQASWTIPLPWRDKLVFFGDYGEEFPRLGRFFTQLGMSWQASARYVVTLPPVGDALQELQLGFDFKRTNNNLAFGGFTVSKQFTEIDQFPIIYNASVADPFGRAIFYDQLVLSPGDLSSRNTDEAFQPSLTQSGVFDAKARYAYDTATLTQVTQLPHNASWILRGQLQVATTNLLPSEQLGAGGIETVRGYDERAVSGSQGVLATSELRSPPFGVVDALFGTDTGDQMQADAFWDFGYVRQKQLAPGERGGATLASVGAGAHYVLNRFLDMRFEYGWQLHRAPGEDHRGGQAYISIVAGY